jgi:hypothetical protein
MVRVCCVVSILLIVAAIPVAGLAESTRPPSGLHKVGDHWTPYNPPDPATFPAGAKVYTIVAGDTLWDLAQKFYGNAYLWPQLWEQNTYITDSHWIYPGDPLLVQGETAEAAGTAAAVTEGGFATVPQETGETGTATTAAVSTQLPPTPLGKESDIYCFGYLATEEESLPNTVSSPEDLETKYIFRAQQQDIGYATGDVLFIDGGTSTGLVAGETYLVVMKAKQITNPMTKKYVGWHYDFRGQVKILCADEKTATAVVTQACKDIHIGDKLKPLPQIPIPLVRRTAMATTCTPPSGKTKGNIVFAKDFEWALGQGAVVEIDLGRDDMVEPGSFLTVYRDNPLGGPRIILGEVGVLTAEAKTATGMIIQMRYSMVVGDRVEIK